VRAALRLYPFALLLAAWWLLAARGVLGNEFVMPPPPRVLDRARELAEDGTLADAGLATLGRVLLAFALALPAGIALGTLIGRVAAVRMALRPIVAFLFPTPKVALYPALVVVFGLGSASKVALGTSRRAALAKVVIPAALPAILTGGASGSSARLSACSSAR